MRRFLGVLATTGLAAISACGTTVQSTALGEGGGLAMGAERPVSMPYRVEVIGENGTSLPTFETDGRYYVLGDAGERYSIHVTNPTSVRVEAVVSVDGLDVIDGESADYVHKRGYVIAPGGQLRVDGWRTSLHSVAAFRFSSVRSSYAGRKGMARNVGVIGVALFAEREQPQLVLDAPPVITRSPHRGRDWGSVDTDVSAESSGPSSDRVSPAPPPRAGATRRKSAPRRDRHTRRRTSRPGLGTGYGENRASSVSWTRFERSHPTRPTALAELRYNDSAGLAAIGIPVDPQEIDDREITRRETAQPFAQPPR